MEIRINLKDDNEIKEFEKMCEFANKFIARKRNNAEMVFNAWKDGLKKIDIDQLDDEAINNEIYQWEESLRNAINNHLTPTTFSYLVDLIINNHEKIKQTARSHIRHAENRAMKQEVFKWLDDNMQNYKSMEAAATAITGGIAPIAWSTARRWVSEWKKLSSTGRG